MKIYSWKLAHLYRDRLMHSRFVIADLVLISDDWSPHHNNMNCNNHRMRCCDRLYYCPDINIPRGKVHNSLLNLSVLGITLHLSGTKNSWQNQFYKCSAEQLSCWWQLKAKISFFFLKNIRGYLENLWTNTRLVCTHLNAFFILNPNIVMKIWFFFFFENSGWIFDLSCALVRVNELWLRMGDLTKLIPKEVSR